MLFLKLGNSKVIYFNLFNLKMILLFSIISNLKERFPFLSKKEVLKILTFGLRMLHYVNKRGSDVIFKNDHGDNEVYTAYIGNLYKNPMKMNNYSIFKWAIKTRILHSLKKIEWDGYYYFGLSKARQEEALKQINNNRKKNIDFGNLFFYKIKEELYYDYKIDHIYRIKYPIDAGYKFYLKSFKTKRDFEYLGQRLWADTKQRIHLQEA